MWLVDLKDIPPNLSGSYEGEPLVFLDTGIIRTILNKLPISVFDIHSNYQNRVSHLLDPKMCEELRSLKKGFLQEIAQMKSKNSKNESFFDFFENLLETTLI